MWTASQLKLQLKFLKIKLNTKSEQNRICTELISWKLQNADGTQRIAKQVEVLTGLWTKRINRLKMSVLPKLVFDNWELIQHNFHQVPTRYLVEQKWFYGEGNGNPLQCSCLENPRDRGAWWAAVYGVAQSRTRLKRLSGSSSRLQFPHT